MRILNRGLSTGVGVRSVAVGLLAVVGCGPAEMDRTESVDSAVHEPVQAETAEAWTFSNETSETLRPEVLDEPPPEIEVAGEDVELDFSEGEVLDARGPDTAWVVNREVVWTHTTDGERTERYRSANIGYLYSGAEFGLFNSDTLVDLMWEVWGTDAGGMVLFGREGEPEMALGVPSCSGISLKDLNGDGLMDVQTDEGVMYWWSCSDLMFISCFGDYVNTDIPVFYLQTEDGFVIDTVASGPLYAPFVPRLRAIRARLIEEWPKDPEGFEAGCDVEALIAELEAQAVRMERLAKLAPPS